MLKKTLRLNTEQVSALMEKGKIFHSPFFTVRLLSGCDSTGFAAIMSKKVGKTAVARNTARRRVYEALVAGGIHDSIKKGTHIAILCKDKTIKTDMLTLANDLKTLLKKISVL